MSIFQRITIPHSAQMTVVEPVVEPRFRYPGGVFAALTTEPEELAGLAYDLFRANHLTPGVAERLVSKLLDRARANCPPVESSPGFAFDITREVTSSGRLRVFAHYLIQMQLNHESNQIQLRALREVHHTRRLRILPGCCEVCDKLARRAWRAADPPALPAPGCLRVGGCKCVYVPAAEC